MADSSEAGARWMLEPRLPTRNASVALERVAQEEAPVLLNLAQLYAHDFSEHVRVELNASGRFDVPLGDVWWTREDHAPFFIRCDGKLAGFALVRRGSRVTGDADAMDVAEFFVVRGARRSGVGMTAAHALFEAAGDARWEIRVRRSNPAALRFWMRVVEAWTMGAATSAPFEASGVEWDLLRFGCA